MRKIAAVVAALMLPAQVQALGVGGDIEWNSALNQPLDAEISLFSLGSTGQHDIKVKLAPYEAYERAGIEYPSILRELKFSIEQRHNGEFYIKLRSANAIKDPFLDILIEIDWPSGHLLREYTVLLDLPVLSDESASPVVSAPVTTAVVSADSVVAISSDGGVTAAAKAVTSPAAPVSGGSIYGETVSAYVSGDLRYGMVKRGDTLWGIAESMRTDKSVSVQQVMMALLKNNPDAFYDNNINNLKAGYVLRLDDPSTLTDMSKSSASREAQRHYQSWMAAKKGGVSSAAMTASAQPATSVGGGAESGASGASLKLVSPDDADLTAMPKTAGGDSQAQNFTNKDLETLRQELAYTTESSDAERQENTQLRSRIVEMEEQIGKMQRLLTLRDDALSVLQTQSQDSVPEGALVLADAAADAMVADAGPDSTKEAAQDVVAVTGDADSATPDMLLKPTEQPVATPVIKPVKKPAKPVAAAPTSEQGVIDIALGYVNKAVAAAGSLLSPLVLGGVIGGALLLGGGFWFLRKRKISGDDLEQSMMIEVADKQLSDDMANGTVSDLSEPKEETSAVDLLDTAGSDNIEADIDEIDVLAEADVYLAYQRFDRAEELLRDAVENEPQRYDLMLKLLEVFAASDNRDGFIEMAERCQANGGQDDTAVWSKVVSLAAGVAVDHPLFSDAASVSEVDDGLDSDLPGGDLDMDFGSLDDDMMSGLDDAPVDEISSTLDDLNLDSEVAPAEPVSNDDGLALDADIGLDSDDVTTAAVTETDDDNALNFDMDDVSLDTEIVDTAPAPAATDDAAASLDDGLELDVSDDNALEFDGGLDMAATDEAVVEAASELADDSVADDDNALSFDMDEVSLDLDSEGTDSAESELVLDEADDTLSLDDGLELSVGDDNSLEFDSDVLASASAELQIDDAGEDENPVLLEVDTDDSAIDADLSDDIDWLTSVADDAVDSDDQSDSLFSSEDEVATKLDLIRAYIDMGDKDSARNILTEVVEEGNNDQKEEAQELLRQIG